MSSMAGELVTETLDYDGGRQVTVYVPPDPVTKVVMIQRDGEHGGAFWMEEFPLILTWAFGELSR